MKLKYNFLDDSSCRTIESPKRNLYLVGAHEPGKVDHIRSGRNVVTAQHAILNTKHSCSRGTVPWYSTQKKNQTEAKAKVVAAVWRSYLNAAQAIYCSSKDVLKKSFDRTSIL